MAAFGRPRAALGDELEQGRNIPGALFELITAKIHEFDEQLEKKDITPKRRRQIEDRREAWMADLDWIAKLAESHRFVTQELLSSIVTDIHTNEVKLREGNLSKKDRREHEKTRDDLLARLTWLNDIAEKTEKTVMAAYYADVLAGRDMEHFEERISRELRITDTDLSNVLRAEE